MNPAKMVSRLAAGTCNYAGAGRGGEPMYTQADIALAVGQVSERAGQLLVLRKWAGHWDAAAQAELNRLLLLRVVDDLAIPGRWSVRGTPGRLQAMIAAAIEEVVNPGVCTSCNGQGHALKRTEEGVVQLGCEACGGSGRMAVSGRERARRCGMLWETFRSPWADRYDAIMRLVDGLIVDSLYQIKRALG